MIGSRLIIFISLLLLPTAAALAAPRTEVMADKSPVYAGLTFYLKVYFDWPKAEGPYTFTIPDLHLENLSLVRQGTSQETFIKESNEWTRKILTFELQSLSEGHAKIESFEILHTNLNSQQSGHYRVENQYWDILPAPQSVNPLLKILLPTLGMALMIILAAHYFSKGRKEKKTAPLSEEEIALEKIKKLTSFSYAPSRKQLFLELTSIFKDYLGKRYSSNFLSMTDQEIINLLNKKDDGRNEMTLLKRLLDKIDETKYTGRELSENEFDAIRTHITSYIEGCRVIGNHINE